MIRVYEEKIKVYMLQDVHYKDVLCHTSEFIDSAMGKDERYLKLHKKNCFKNYCFGGLYPIERNSVYRKGSIYEITVRTCDSELADYLIENLPEHSNSVMKGLVGEKRILPRKVIDTVYTLTPIIVRGKDVGYWRDNLSFDEFEQRIKINLVKKYKSLTGVTISENFILYNFMNVKNKTPIPVKYKNIKLLGDKVEIQVANNPTAQELIYIALGVGLCEKNARGFGFLGYRYL